MQLNLLKYLKNRLLLKNYTYNVLSESIGIVLLFFATVIVVYIAPASVDKIFFGILFLRFWYSKKDYFWIAFFIIITLFPGGFFTEISLDASRKLPTFSIMPKVTFSIYDIFLIVALMKAIIKGDKHQFRDYYNMKIMIIVLLLMFYVSFFFGMSLNRFLNQTLRGLFFYTFFVSFPSLINSKKDIYKFMYLFFPFVFFEIFSQMYLIQTRMDLITLVNPETVLTSGQDVLMGDLRPVANGYGIVICAFIFGFVFLENKEILSPRPYILLVIFISALSILLSATRQSIIMISFMFILYVFFISYKKANVFIQIFLILLLFIIFLDFINVWDFGKLFSNSFNRMMGAFSVDSGTITAEDTLEYRLENRLPALLAAIQDSLLLGYGFSDDFYNYYDGHLGGVFVGLLQAGVVGLMFFVYFIINIFRVNIYYIRKLKNDNSHTLLIKVFTMGFAGFALVNTFIDPIFMFNVFMKPQIFFIMLLILSIFIRDGKKELALKRKINIEIKKGKNSIIESVKPIYSNI